MVNVDTAGGTVLFAESLRGDPDRSWDGLVDKDELKQIPIEHFRVLKIESVTEMGDARKGRKLDISVEELEGN